MVVLAEMVLWKLDGFRGNARPRAETESTLLSSLFFISHSESIRRVEIQAVQSQEIPENLVTKGHEGCVAKPKLNVVFQVPRRCVAVIAPATLRGLDPAVINSRTLLLGALELSSSIPSSSTVGEPLSRVSSLSVSSAR